MKEYIEQSQRRAKSDNGVFFVYSAVTFLLLSTILYSVDFVPELTTTEAHDAERVLVYESSTDVTATKINDTSNGVDSGVLFDESYIPVRISIEAIGIDTPILTPDDTETEVLDRALLQGSVLYPGSGMLGENANLLIFGHSSYLPIVKNKAFKAFNELEKLKAGDTINIESTSHRYTYIVEEVYQKPAEQVRVDFTAKKPTLTLATCNTFGAKEDRWIVTARLDTKKRIY